MSKTAHDFDFRSAIEAMISAFAKAFDAKDAAAIAEMYAEDATLLPPGAPLIKGRSNIQGFWQSFIGAGASDARLRLVEVLSDGDLAYEIGTFEAKVPSPQGVVPSSGKYVVVWKRRAEGIRMVADIFNLDA